MNKSNQFPIEKGEYIQIAATLKEEASIKLTAAGHQIDCEVEIRTSRKRLSVSILAQCPTCACMQELQEHLHRNASIMLHIEKDSAQNSYTVKEVKIGKFVTVPLSQ
jgi:hypothetical protein